MALINRLNNTASVTYGGSSVNSNTVSTLLLLAPTLLKTVDKPTAGIGEILTYTITITNVSLSEITNLPFSDMIPPGSSYVSDSFKLNDISATPTLTSGTLTYTIPSIPALGVAKIQFQVEVIGGDI